MGDFLLIVDADLRRADDLALSLRQPAAVVVTESCPISALERVTESPDSVAAVIVDWDTVRGNEPWFAAMCAHLKPSEAALLVCVGRYTDTRECLRAFQWGAVDVCPRTLPPELLSAKLGALLRIRAEQRRDALVARAHELRSSLEATSAALAQALADTRDPASTRVLSEVAQHVRRLSWVAGRVR
jgi:DNA-binding response OmpR family regulator